MFDTIYSWITTCLQFALDTFVLILDKTETGSFYLSGMFLIAIFGFILTPMVTRGFAGSGSDQASSKSSSHRVRGYNYGEQKYLTGSTGSKGSKRGK